jgi:hypothetical protein
MLISDFKRLTAAHAIGRVDFMRVMGEGWHVYAYDVTGGNVIKQYGHQLMGTRGEPRMYTSLDRAWEAVRAAGYGGVIDIDG